MKPMDEEYERLVQDILSLEEFKKMKEFVHHGQSRYDHSIKVSYDAYKIAKKRNLDYTSVARAGLLHDFFEIKNESSIFSRIKSFFIHPVNALNNSEKYFELSEKEKNIIKSHMFPANLIMPRYRESFLVSAVDKKIATREQLGNVKFKMRYAGNLVLLVILNLLK